VLLAVLLACAPSARGGIPRGELTAKPNPLLLRTCAVLERRARAQGVRRRVHCPPLIPSARPLEIELAGGLSRYRRFAAGYQVGLWAPGLEADDLGGHWSFAGGRPEAFTPYLRRSAPSLRPSSTTHAVLAGRRVTIYRMPRRASAFYAGHVVVQWRHGRDAYNVTAHGWRNEPAARLMAAALIRKMVRTS